MKKLTHVLQLAIMVSAIFIFQLGYGQVTETFTTDDTFEVPPGVNEIEVRVWGGGGRGGSSGANPADELGGGGGGAYASTVIPVYPGQTYNFTVGAGGNNTTVNGGNSIFYNTDGSTVLLNAGGGTGRPNGSADRTGGPGGLVNVGPGFAGGTGGSGLASNTYGGGGGSSAGYAAVGTNAGTPPAAGIAPDGGGDGGSGGGTSASTPGSDGSAPGGGGGGARGNAQGGLGAGGQVQIVYSYVYYPEFSESNGNLIIVPLAGGTVDVDPPTGPYPYGSTVTLTATANPGYVFDNFEYNPIVTDPVLVLTMTDTFTVTATFTLLAAVPLSNWALLLGIALIVIFMAFRFRSLF